jgi:TolA-binding protein
MKKLFLVILLGIGGWYWAKENLQSQKIMAYAQKKKDPQLSPKIEYYLGLYHETRTEYPRAVQVFEQLLTDYPSSQFAASALIKLAASYERNGRRDDALNAYRTYLERWPNGDRAGLAQSNADRLANR